MQTIPRKVSNVCWSLGKGISEERMLWGIDIARQEKITRLRLYDSAPTPARFFEIAKEQNMRVTMGAWLDTTSHENVEQLRLLTEAIINGLVEPTAIVGNEVLLFKRMSPAMLISYLEHAKRELPEHVAVTTAEDAKVLIKHPQLIDAQRHIVGIHHYPFAHGVHIDEAMADFVRHYNQIRALSNGKRVVVYETGWPSDGGTIGKAVASVANFRQFHREFADWVYKNSIEAYLFQLINEPWKAQFGNPHEAHWGLRHEDGSHKC